MACTPASLRICGQLDKESGVDSHVRDIMRGYTVTRITEHCLPQAASISRSRVVNACPTYHRLTCLRNGRKSRALRQVCSTEAVDGKCSRRLQTKFTEAMQRHCNQARGRPFGKGRQGFYSLVNAVQGLLCWLATGIAFKVESLCCDAQDDRPHVLHHAAR